MDIDELITRLQSVRFSSKSNKKIPVYLDEQREVKTVNTVETEEGLLVIINSDPKQLES